MKLKYTGESYEPQALETRLRSSVIEVVAKQIACGIDVVTDGEFSKPGIVTHASNIVEHPQLIAERIVRFAKLVGRENVIACSDCGFSSQALYKAEVHHTIVWEKFKAMR